MHPQCTPTAVQVCRSQILKQLLEKPRQRFRVRGADDVSDWIKTTQQRLAHDKTVIATFIIDTQQQLQVGTRHLYRKLAMIDMAVNLASLRKFAPSVPKG